jgi:hypothetical protein
VMSGPIFVPIADRDFRTPSDLSVKNVLLPVP